jgi:hypothetical protein
MVTLTRESIIILSATQSRDSVTKTQIKYNSLSVTVGMLFFISTILNYGSHCPPPPSHLSLHHHRQHHHHHNYHHITSK